MSTISQWQLGYIPEGFPYLPYPLLPMTWGRRLLFPIADASGKIVGFGGRKIVADDRPKYVNSPTSTVYKKGEVLYGYHRIPQKTEVIYLCEGYVDVLSMDAHGFGYPVASLGTALTQEQAVLIRQKAKMVCICFDADDAGQKNAIRAIGIFLKSGFKASEISVMIPQEAKDVDEALTRGCGLCQYTLFAYLWEQKQSELLLDALLTEEE